MIKVKRRIQFLLIEESKMSIKLLESIINGDYVSANRLFEERLSNIKEKKIYEAKRMFAADLNEVLGGKTRAQAEKEIRARGMVPRKASDVYGDPRDTKISGPTGKKTTTKDDLGVNLQKLGKQWKNAKFGERKAAIKMVHAAVKQYAGTRDMEKPSTKAPAPTPSAPDARAERNRQSWDKLRNNLAAKMDRKSAMEKKRKDFLANRPMLRAAGKLGTAGKLVGKALSSTPAKIAGGVVSDIASAVSLEE